MVKYIGMAVAIIGLLLTLLVYLLGRRNGIREKQKELKLIQSEGYVSMHKAAPGKKLVLTEGIKAETGVKAPPKKRALRKEAKEILELVEKEKKAEREQTPASAAVSKDDQTDIMGPRKRSGSKAVTSADTEKTGVLNRKSRAQDTDETGTLPPKSSRKENAAEGSDGTDLLVRRSGQQEIKEPTGILPRRKKSRSEDDSTGILPPKAEARSAKDPEEDEATGILKRKEPSSRPDIDIETEPTGMLDRKRPADDSGETGVLLRKGDDGDETGILVRRDGDISDGEATGILRRR